MLSPPLPSAVSSGLMQATANPCRVLVCLLWPGSPRGKRGGEGTGLDVELGDRSKQAATVSAMTPRARHGAGASAAVTQPTAQRRSNARRDEQLLTGRTPVNVIAPFDGGKRAQLLSSPSAVPHDPWSAGPAAGSAQRRREARRLDAEARTNVGFVTCNSPRAVPPANKAVVTVRPP